MMWTLSCIKATGEAYPCCVRRSDMKLLLSVANLNEPAERVDGRQMSSSSTQPQSLSAASPPSMLSRALCRADELPMPPWMEPASKELLNTTQVAAALEWLSISQPEIERLFEAYAKEGAVGHEAFLAFTREEQVDLV